LPHFGIARINFPPTISQESGVSDKDRVFFKNFALLIASLMAFTVIIAIAGNYLGEQATRPENPDRMASIEARIAPVGTVYSGAAGRTALAEDRSSADSSGGGAAFDGSLDGEMIYNSVCTACHTAGVAGAPKLEQAAWDARIAQGMDTMVEHAVLGFTGAAGMMPAKGGKMDLTDEQVQVTVQWMLDNLQ
jgi:cytochrome c5